MKPERIQFAPLIALPLWGIYRTFWFDSYRQAETFSDFVTDMVENRGREVFASIDSEDNELTFEFPADASGEIDGALALAREVADLYEQWNGPIEVS